MKDKLLALLKALGILPDDKVQALSAELDKLDLEKKPEPTIDSSKITDPAMKQMFEALNNQITVLGNQNKTLLDTINAERSEREKAVKLQQDQAKSDAEKKVTELVARAKKEGKIVQAKEEWLKKYAVADLAAAEEWVKDAPVQPGFKPEPEKKSSSETSSEKTDRAKGPLGSVNQSILKNVLEQSSTN
jgi:phage I-like protein